MEKTTMSVQELSAQMGISLPKAYELVKTPEFPTIRTGARILIPIEAYKEWLVITKDQMRKFLKFVHDDVVYCKYYEVVYILFHTGMRISEFCGLTLKDIDFENRTVNIDHQLQRTSDMRYIIETTKTDLSLIHISEPTRPY